MMEIDTPQGKLALQIGGTIDRLDSKGDTLRIVDYKTGGTPKTPENIEQLFTPADNRPNYIFQTFLYAAILCRKQSLKVAPSLLYIHRGSSKNFFCSSIWTILCPSPRCLITKGGFMAWHVKTATVVPNINTVSVLLIVRQKSFK